MLNNGSHFSTYLVSVALEYLGNRLIGIVATDSYLRQPDYSSRAENHYYFILSDNLYQEDIWILRYIAREFPESLFNFIYEFELADYPPHVIWQFQFSEWLYKKNNYQITMPERDVLEERRQAIFACCHLSRLYYIRNLNLKTHIWGVRQFGWAVRYALNGLFNLDQNDSLNEQETADRNWLIDFQNNWMQHKRKLTNSEAAFRDAASYLSEIASRKAEDLQRTHPVMDILVSAAGHDTYPENIASAVNAVRDRLTREIGPSLLSFYLHGSAARGDMRPGSDIDSFIIVDHVSRDVLERVRSIQSDNPPFTILVYSLAEVNHYPKFRRYGLVNGTKLVSGDLCLSFKPDINDDIAGIINNIFIVRQVARAYLIEGSYGERSHYIAALMAKLIDHGCLRPVQKLKMGIYPTSRAEIRSFFSDVASYTHILSFIDNLEFNEQTLQEALFRGDITLIEQLFHELSEAACLVEIQTKNLV
ncbi:nucleotidyltransferase domain-containing protein [uncultured Cedecea sp.]|uniref:nucleotidyltransferase domain-containing protein n=1 Tax=uncultured Cedecea sp. TaxID=988762 RepID=UPI002631B806|nr:nucleotidyltransferase domain-containing protein [uncultured Cedecea sp.]